MSDAQPETGDKKGFGRNQKIALGIFSVVFASVYALVWTGHIDGPTFTTFAQWFGPASTLFILAPSAAVKAFSTKKEEESDVGEA